MSARVLRAGGVLGGVAMERRAPWRSAVRGATATLAWLDLLGADPLGAGASEADRPAAGQTTFRPFEQTLTRVNFRGRRVSLAGGVAAAAGVLGAAVRPLREAQRADLPARSRRTATLVAAAALVAGASAAGAGLVDDLDQGAHDGEAPAKGLRGHLTALSRGHVTTGVLKIGFIGAGALGAGALLSVASRPGALTGAGGRVGGAGLPDGGLVRRAADTAVRAAVIASWANVHNLLDLRPGRALKVAGLISASRALAPAGGAPGTEAHVVAQGARVLAGGGLGVVVASLPTDLTERTMLGDTGANAVGALVGTAVAASASPWVRGAAAVTGTALVLVSERVSYSAVITRNPVLSALDGLGRHQEP